MTARSRLLAFLAHVPTTAGTMVTVDVETVRAALTTMESTPEPGAVNVFGRPREEHRFNGAARIQGILWELCDRGDARDRVPQGRRCSRGRSPLHRSGIRERMKMSDLFPPPPTAWRRFAKKIERKVTDESRCSEACRGTTTHRTAIELTLTPAGAPARGAGDA